MMVRFSPLSSMVVVPFRGPIVVETVEPYAKILRKLKTWNKIKGVIFTINSSGGDAAASEILKSEIVSLGSVKPVYAYVESIAASGGYYVACGASKIYAPPNAIVGSIGVIFIKPVLADLMDRIGLLLEILTEGKHKDMSFPHRKSTPEEKKKMQSLLKDAYERFIEIVSTSRKMSKEQVRNLATGEVFSSQKALELGLIDGLKSYEEVVDELAKKTKVSPKRITEVKPKKPLLARLVRGTVSDLALDLEYNLLHGRINY